MKKTVLKILATFLTVTLISCGSNQTEPVVNQLSSGISSSTTSANFGKTASAEDVKAMSAKLGSYFNGQYASNPKALMGVQASASKGSSGLSATPMVAASNVASAVFRFYNTVTGAHFFTMSEEESYYVQNTYPAFKFEGKSFMAFHDADPSLSPVYRFYNNVTNTHFFTISAEEKAYVQATWPTIFTFEGISWYANTAEGSDWVPVYRFFNTKTGTHFYTTSAAEKDYVLATWSWFTFEGIAYFVKKADTSAECGVTLPEKTLATLPKSYSSKLLDANFSTNKIFLTNTGYVAWSSESTCNSTINAPCSSFAQIGIKLYNTATDSISTKNPSNGPLSLVSLNDAGVVLMNESTSLMMINDQFADINTLPFAKLWDGVTTTDSVVRAPIGMNHRAGRHTFSIPMAGVNDGSGRKWAYPNFPSYLDGAKLVNTSTTLSLGNFPGAVNHCGIAVENAGYTKDGLYFSRGTKYINNIGIPFTADSNAYPRILPSGLSNSGTTFGVLSDAPAKFPMLGFIRSTSDQKYYLNSEIIDVNDANTGVGHKVAGKVEIGIGSYSATEGQIMAADGAQSLKPLVPSLAASTDILLPKAINNSGQIAVQTCTPSGYGGCLAPAKLYLLTPQ